MQVKKFEAPTLQEALDTIKRELGPEAIILQTKQNRRGFGLMSKGSVEVTAAVSERSLDKKKDVEKRLPEAYTQKITALNASKQADVYESYLEKRLEKDKVQLSTKKITAVRYADIEDDSMSQAADSASEHTYSKPQPKPTAPPIPQYSAPKHVENAIETYSSSRDQTLIAIQDELANLKRLVEELRRERKMPDYIDSDSPFSATEALQESYETILQSGVERRFAVQIMREVSRELGVEARADQEAVLDAIADRLLKKVETRPFFNGTLSPGAQEFTAFVGISGVGKTAVLAKLATHAARTRNEKVGLIRIQLSHDEGADPLLVFSKALHVPYRAVSNSEELAVAIQDMSQCQRIFVDTPGVSSRDLAGIRRLQIILTSQPRIHCQLVVSCTTRDLELREQAKAFSSFAPTSLMFTRLDESYSFGTIYSLSSRLQLPLSVFSTGRKVTEDWENATPERLTASILNIL